MFCGNCGASVPDGARFCGACGHSLIDADSLDTGSEQQPAQQQSFFPQQDSAEESNGSTPDRSGIQETIDRSLAEQSSQYQDSGYGFVPEPPAPPEPPKRKKGLLIGGIVAAVVIIAALAVALNFKSVSNTVMRAFASPESYYRHVEKQSMGDVIDHGTDIYDNTLVENLGSDSRTVTSNTTITVGEPVRELVESLAGLDMDWLETISIAEKATLVDGNMGINLDASLNGVAIASAEIVADEDDIYFRVPEIRDDFARIDQRSMVQYGINIRMQSTRMALMSLLQTLPEVMPDSKQLDRMLNRYVEVIVDNIDDVEKGSDTLAAGSVSQKYTTLTVHLEDDDLARIIEALCDTALEDEDLKQIVTATVDAAGADPDDAWDELVDELEDLRDNADRIQAEIDMTVFVDGKGEICGRTIVVNDYVKLEYAAPEAGSSYGLRLAVSRDDFEQFVFEGGGKKNDGTFELQVEELHILDIAATNFDRDALKEGFLNGTFDVSLSSFVANQLEDELSFELGGRMLDLRDVHLILDSSASKNKNNIVMRLLLGEDEYLAVSADASASKGGQVAVPEDSMSVENWVQKINATNLDPILDHLEDAGVPDRLLRLVFYGH